jgi:hypothetical protein
MSQTTTKLAIGYAEWHEREAAQLRAHNAHSPLMPELADMHAETAHVLRTLAAERDILRVEVDTLRQAVSGKHAPSASSLTRDEATKIAIAHSTSWQSYKSDIKK